MDGEPRSVTRRWPDPVDGPFTLRYWVGYPGGRPAVVGVEMWGVDPKRLAWDGDREGLPDVPVTAAAIRLPLGKMLDDWLSVMGNLAQSSIELWGDEPGQRMAAESYIANLEAKPKRGPEFLEAVARVYLAARDAGSRRPNRAVEEWARLEGIERDSKTIRGWVYQAGRMGLLPSGQPGKIRTEDGQ